MDSIEHFSESKNLARVAAGLKGGPFNSSPNLAPKLTFANGWPSETMSKLDASEIKQGTPIDVWNVRRANGV